MGNGLPGDILGGICQLSPKSHSIQLDSRSGSKLSREEKDIVQGYLLDFIVQAHSGWVSLQLMFVCSSLQIEWLPLLDAHAVSLAAAMGLRLSTPWPF